jgi:hypothetical protein
MSAPSLDIYTIKDSSSFLLIQEFVIRNSFPAADKDSLLGRSVVMTSEKLLGWAGRGLIFFFSRKRADFKAELVLMAVKVLGRSEERRTFQNFTKHRLRFSARHRGKPFDGHHLNLLGLPLHQVGCMIMLRQVFSHQL